MKSPTFIRSACLTLLLALASGTARAQTTYVKANTSTLLNTTGSWTPAGTPGSGDIAAWTASIGTAGNRSIALGGNVNWGKILFNAADPGGDITIANTGGATLTLSGINGVGIDMGWVARNLTISDPITLGASQTWSSSSGQTLTVGYPIGGSSYALTKAGLGQLTLNPTTANTFAGGLVVNCGTLLEDLSTMTTPTDLINNGNGLTLGGGTLIINGKGSAVTGQVFSGLTVNQGYSYLTNNVGTATSVTTTLGGITRNSGGTVGFGTTGAIATTKVNVNSILGPWGFFGIGSGTKYAVGSTAGSSTTIAGLTGTAAATAANVIDTTGAFNYDVAAVGTLGASANFNTLRYTGSAGTIAGACTANGLMTTAAALTMSGALSIGSTKELVVNPAGAAITLSGVISDNGGGMSALTVGGGTSGLTLTAINTFTGPVTFGGGTLNVTNIFNGGVASSLGQSSASATNLVLGNGANLTYSGTNATSDRLFTMNGNLTLTASAAGGLNLTNTGAIAFGVTNQAATLSLTASAGTFTNVLAATINDNGSGAIALNKTGTGTWWLTSSNNFSGGVTFNKGFLMFSSGALGTNGIIGFGVNSVPPFGLIWAPGCSDDISSRFTGANSANGGIGTLNTGTNNVVFASGISPGKNPAWLIKDGTGSLTLNTASAWGSVVGGATTINAGTWVANVLLNGGNNDSIGGVQSGAQWFGLRDGTTFKYIGTGAGVDHNFNMSGNVTIDASGTGPLAFLQTGPISPTPGPRLFSLTSGQPTTGNAPSTSSDMVPGTLVAGSGIPAGTHIASIGINSQLTFDQNATATTVNLPVTFGSYAAGTLTLTGTNTGANMIAGILQDSVSGIDASVAVRSLAKTGTGTWFLSGANTYSGNTTLSAGTLVGVTGGGCASSAVTVNSASSAILGVSISDSTKQWTCASLTIAGTSPSLTFGYGVSPSTTLAPLKVTGDLTFTTTPTLTVDPANLVNGGIYPLLVYGGTLSGTAPTTATIGNGLTGTLAWGTGSPYSTKTLVLTVGLGGPAATRVPPLKWQTVTGNWDTTTTGVWKDSTSAAVTYTDGLVVGDAVIFDDTPTTAPTVTLNTSVKPASITVNNPTKAVTISGTGSISGPGSLSKAGAAALTLSTANNYTGGTTLSAGQITIGNGSAFGSGPISVTGNSTLGQTAAFTVVNNLDVANGVTLTNSGLTSTFSGIVSGSGNINGSGYTLGNTGNTFTGKLTNINSTVTINSLGDASSIELGVTSTGGTFTFAGTTPTTFNTRFFNLTGTTGGATFNNNSAVALTINPNLSVTGSGPKTISFGGTGGFSTFGGKITELGGATTLSFGGTSPWYLSNTTSDYTGSTTINGPVAIVSIAPYGTACSLGKGTAGVAIVDGGNGSPSLTYVGAGNTTDRQFQIGYSGNGSGAPIYNNGTGALTLTATTFNVDPTAVQTRTLTLGGTFSGGINEIQGIIIKTVGDIAINKAADASIWKFSGACAYTSTTQVRSGTLILNGNTGSLNGSTGTALTLGGTGGAGGTGSSATFIYDNTSSTGTKSQNMLALTLGGNENTIQSTKGGASSATLTFASVTARAAGNAANFVSGGATDTANKIVLTATANAPVNGSGSNDRGIFFSGTEYARYDTTAGYFRAVTYGTDNNASALVAAGTTLGINDATKDVKLGGAISGQTTAAVNTLNLTNYNLTLQDASQTLSVNGILSSGASSASIATAGKIQATANGGEIVIRVNGSSDVLSIAPVIQNAGATATPLTKSGAGTLNLNSAETYTGTTSVDAGALLFNAVNTGVSAVTVATGATLGGSGTIPGAVTVLSGGIIQPSLSGGVNTLTLSSATSPSFTAAPGVAVPGFNGGSILKIRVPTTTTADKVSLSSAGAIFACGNLNLSIDASALAGTPSANVNALTIVSTANASGVTGKFASTNFNSGSYTTLLTYNANSVTITLTAPPTATAQTFCSGATVANLVATTDGSATVKWYNVITGGSALSSGTALSTGTYYVSQTVNGLESSRVAVSVTVNSSPVASALNLTNNAGVAYNLQFTNLTANAPGVGVSAIDATTSGGQTLTKDGGYTMVNIPNTVTNGETFSYTVTNANCSASGLVTVYIVNSYGIAANTITNLGGGNLGMVFYGQPSTSYHVQRGTNVDFTGTTTLFSVGTDSNGVIQYTNNPGGVDSYYRLQYP